MKRLVGTDLEQGAVYALDAKNNLIGLDLDSRRTRSVLSQVREATVGPDGAVYAVDSGAVVTQIIRRTPVRFRTKLTGAWRGLYGTMNGALVAVPAADRAEAMALTSDQALGRAPLPGGAAAATYLGDLVAVAADSAVILYEPQGKQPVRVLPVDGHARAVAFSPSGHRVYVARGKGDIQVFDRFSNDALGTIDLPGPARELRGDLYGAWLLARPEKGRLRVGRGRDDQPPRRRRRGQVGHRPSGRRRARAPCSCVPVPTCVPSTSAPADSRSPGPLRGGRRTCGCRWPGSPPRSSARSWPPPA